MNSREIIVEQLLRTVWMNVSPHLWGQENNTKTRACVKNDFHNAFINKIAGFLGELRYAAVTKENPAILAGGWFVPVAASVSSPIDGACYYTVADHNDDRLLRVYKILRSLLPNLPLFLIEPHHDLDISSLSKGDYNYLKFDGDRFVPADQDGFFSNWQKKSRRSLLIERPDFDSEVNCDVVEVARKLLLATDAFDEILLRNLLLDRHFFDIELSGSYFKGRPTDLDFIKITKSGQLRLVDVKCKYVDSKGQLGTNADHLPFFVQMDALLGTQSAYVVSLRKNANQLAHIGWYYTNMSKFCGAKQELGNAGMNGRSAKLVKMVLLHEMVSWNGYPLIPEHLLD